MSARTRDALVTSVIGEWMRRGIEPRNAITGNRLAEAAVSDVVSALRANPAWARSLGIGVTSQQANQGENQ